MSSETCDLPSSPHSYWLTLLQMAAGDRGLVNAFKEISVMADRLNLPRSIVVSGDTVTIPSCVT